MNINFFSTSDNARYNMFIIPHILSVLYHVKNSHVEIVIKDCEKFKKENKEALDILYREYGNRFLIRQMSTEFDHIKYVHIGQIFRFLDQPEVKCKYTYIGDIDILTLDTDIVETHRQLMNEQRVPYSNIVRPDSNRLTGCMCLETKPYYDKVKYKIKEFLNSPESVYYPILNDEILLYNLVKPALGLPKYNTGKYRPIHGIHISLNRPYPLGNKELGELGWGINAKVLEKYNRFRNSDIFKELESYFTDEFSGFISAIDNVKL